MNRPPLVAHVIHALRVGGLENGLVNLINRMPAERYRHAVICLTGYDRFAERIARDDVRVFALDKKEGKDPVVYWRLWRLLRQLRPEIVHTRNFGALEAQLPAFLAGVPARVHGEHGRDMTDLSGDNRRYRRIRRILRPLVHRYIPLSRDLEAYLRQRVDVPAERITRIINGVDIERFRPDTDGQARGRLLAETGWPEDSTLIGWVGRMEPVKNPLGLVEAFATLRREQPEAAARARLVMIGGGSLYEAVRRAVVDAGLDDRVWLPGSRDDVPELLRGLDLFVLPSLAEGISNTILEALASGLPVVATQVGGNAELVVPDVCGALVPAGDRAALARAFLDYLACPGRLAEQGARGRARAVEVFSIDTMVSAYAGTYDRVLADHGRVGRREPVQSETV